MQRREFLRMAGVAGLSVSLLPARSVGAIWRAPSDRTPTARIRYCGAWGDPLRDATMLADGDPQLAVQGVRLHVFGVLPGEASVGGRTSLDVLFPLPERDLGINAPEKLRFLAWSYDDSDVAGAASASNSFVVPLDRRGELELDLIAAGQPFRARLTTGSDRESPKLRRGIYLLSVGPLERAPAGAAFGSQRDLPIRSATLVLTVDSASVAPRSLEPWRI